jgi:hypothetical protein
LQIAHGAIAALAGEGKTNAKDAVRATEVFGIDTEKPNLNRGMRGPMTPR